jgi:hypothetical protein
LKRERSPEIIALGKDLCSLKEMAMKSLYAGPPLKELHEE